MSVGLPRRFDRRRVRMFGPVVFACLAAILVLTLSAAYMIRSFDDSARLREEQMVANGVQLRIDEFATDAVPQLNWDDAVANLDNRFDPDWADQNVASFLYTINGFSHAFVLDAAGQAIYAAKRAERGKPQDFLPFAATVAPLLPELRQREAKRGDLQPSRDGKTMIAEPIQTKGIVSVNGTPFIVIATLVQPDFGTALPSSKAPVVVTAVPVDAKLLGPFASRYLLDRLVIAQPGSDRTDRAASALRNKTGQPVASLMWEPKRPGTALVSRLAVFIAIGICAVLVIGWSLARRGMMIANDLISSEARARHLAYHDTLTQLPNRALMFERARQLFATSRRNGSSVAVHCLDLDRFKEVNDTLGHIAGDALIRKVAQRICEVSRETDTVARLGGDEFVILQPQTNAAGAARLAERISDALSRPFELEFGTVDISCSIGVTMVDGGSLEPTEALRQADLAMYRSKDRGRQRATFFEAEMDAALRLRRSLELDLRQAIADDALAMVYQPQVDLAGRTTGVEALVRWDHPARGAIPPGVFVPLAEETGLILDLGELVFRKVFAETAAWTGLRIAINVSAVQLRSPGFIKVLEKLMQHQNVNPARYEIELTETALLGDDIATRKNILGLKRLGFTIALDDFGTGYSSLSVLQRFSVDKIKIDRSFVKNLGASAESEALVDAMVKLARALNLHVIAEGVETDAQRERLRSCGCEDFQGYFMSRPLDAAGIVKLVSHAELVG